jgi:hypothetical protein
MTHVSGTRSWLVGPVEDRDPGADSLDVHGSHPLRPRLGVSVEPGCRCIEQHLEGVKPGDVRRHRDDRDHAAAESFLCCVLNRSCAMNRPSGCEMGGWRSVRAGSSDTSSTPVQAIAGE